MQVATDAKYRQLLKDNEMSLKFGQNLVENWCPTKKCPYKSTYIEAEADKSTYLALCSAEVCVALTTLV